MAKIRVSGDPKKKTGEVVEETFIAPGKTPLDTTADIRDIISGMAGGGYTSLSDSAAAANYSRLRTLLGDAKANKLMTHIFIQNQRPGAANMPVEARVKSFYDLPVGDEEIAPIIGKAKNFGYGVLPGFRQSSSQLNQELSGAIQPTVARATPAIEKIKVRVANKTQ